MVNEYASVGGGGPSEGYSGAGGGSPGSSYTSNPTSAADAAAASVTGSYYVGGVPVASYGAANALESVAQAKAASAASVEAGGSSSNLSPVGSAEWYNYEATHQGEGGSTPSNLQVGSQDWWNYQINMREAAARTNTALTPVSPTTPGYYEYFAPTYPVGTPQWYQQIAEAKVNEPTGAVAQTPLPLGSSNAINSLSSPAAVNSLAGTQIAPGMYLTGQIEGVLPGIQSVGSPSVYINTLTPVITDVPDIVQTQRENYNPLYGIPITGALFPSSYIKSGESVKAEEPSKQPIISTKSAATNPTLSILEGLEKRSDYIPTSMVGDAETQKLIFSGLTPLQSLNAQIQEAYKTPGTRDENYYLNELSKMAEDYVAISSQYHYEAKKTGLPQAANPYEAVGDLSLGFLKGYGAQPSSAMDLSSLNLPGGKGIQEVQWYNAVQNDKGKTDFLQPDWSVPISVIDTTRLSGEMGPYGNLGSFSSTLGSLSLEQQQDIATRAAKTAGWEINPGKMSTGEMAALGFGIGMSPVYKDFTESTNYNELPSPFVSFLSSKGGETNVRRVETSPAATWLEAGLAAGDALTSLPSTLTFGAIPKWTPGSDLLKNQGLSGSQSLETFQKQLAEVEAQSPHYQNILSNVQSKTSQLNALTAGKINEYGKFTGTPEEYAKVQVLQSDISKGTNAYNEFQTKYQDVLKQGYSSGAIIKGVTGNTYQIAPEVERPYGSFSDWSNSVQKLITGGMTPSKFAMYEMTPEFAAAPWYERVGEGVVKTVTSPQEALQSGVQGIALYAGTAGLGEGLGVLSKSTGKIGAVASGTLKVSELPLVKYGIPATFIGAGLYSAAEGVNIGGPTLIAPKVGEAKFESNVGAMVGGLLWMGAGAAVPGISTRLPNLASTTRNVYEAVNFPNTPTIGEIGGGLKGKVSDTLYSMRQTAGGVENIGPKSGLLYNYNVLPQPGSLDYLRQKGVVFSPPSPEDVMNLRRADTRTTNIFNIKTEGGVAKSLPTMEKFVPQKGSLTYLQEKGIAFNIPSSEDVLRLRRADVETEAIFNARTEGGNILPTIKGEGKIEPMKGSLKYLQEKGSVFSPPSTEDIIRLNRADMRTTEIFNLKTDVGEVKPTVIEEGKITPQKGSLKYLQEKGIAFNVPSVEDVMRLRRAEATTEAIFNARTEGGGIKPFVAEGKISPMKGSFSWLKEQGIIPAKETGPLETPEARGLSNYLGKYYDDLVKEVKTAALNPQSPEILSQLRAATKVEEMRLSKMSAFERGDILKQYDNIVGVKSVKGTGDLTPQVGSLTYLKEKGVIPSPERGPEITISKQKTTDYLAKLHDNLIFEVRRAGFDPTSPQMKSQISAEMKIREQAINKLNLMARNDLFSGRKGLDELLSNRNNLIDTYRVTINKKTWTNKELAERLTPRRWPTTKPEGVESGKGGQVLVQKLAQKADQKLKQEVKTQSKQEAKQEEQKLEKKKKGLLSRVEEYQNYPIAYDVQNYDMANVELSRSYSLKSIPTPGKPISELQSLLVATKPLVVPPVLTIREQPQEKIGQGIVPLTKNISGTSERSMLDIITVPSVANIQRSEVAQVQTPEQRAAQKPMLESMTRQTSVSKPMLDISQKPRTIQELKLEPRIPILPILIPYKKQENVKKRKSSTSKYKLHEQVFQYPFNPIEATKLQVKAIKFGWGSGKKTNAMGKNVVSSLPSMKVPKQAVKINVPKMSMPTFSVSKVGSNTGFKSISLSSPLPQKKKVKK